MKRRLLNLLTALSLLLFVAVLALWSASGTRYRSVAYNKSPDAVYNAGVMRGRALLSAVRRPWGTAAPSSVQWHSLPLRSGAMPGWESFRRPEWRGRFGFLYRADARPTSGQQYRGLVIPLWFPAGLLAIPPTTWAFRRLRTRHLHKRGRTKLCPS